MDTKNHSQYPQSFGQKMALYISDHTIFTGVFITYLSICTFQLSQIQQDFKTNELYYPQYIVAGSFFFLLNVFLMAYNNIEDSSRKERWITLMVSSVLIAAQIWLTLNGLFTLTIDSYPNEFFSYILGAFVLFIISLFIGQVRSVSRLTVPAGLALGVSAIMVQLQFFDGNPLFLQIVSFIFLAFQIPLAFLTAREYFTN